MAALSPASRKSLKDNLDVMESVLKMFEY